METTEIMETKTINIEEIADCAIPANKIPGDQQNLFGGNQRLNITGHTIRALVPIVERQKKETEEKARKRYLVLDFPVYQKPPRVEYKRVEKEDGDYELIAERVVNLPKKMRGVEYIVSRETLRVIKKLYGRNDFVAPGEQIRDRENRVVACRGFLTDFK